MASARWSARASCRWPAARAEPCRAPPASRPTSRTTSGIIRFNVAGPERPGPRTGRLRMAAKMFYDNDADLAIIRGKKVAIIGYGSQGHAHALNLKDSGVQVKVGLPATSRSRAKAQAAGLTVEDVASATKWADVVMVLIPDTATAKVYREEIEPNLKPGDML